MDLNKHLEIYNPTEEKRRLHIIGVGALGSYIALQLAKLGVDIITIWDNDIVTPHNITNQAYVNADINTSKVDAIEKQMLASNPEMTIIKKNKRWDGEVLNGVVFLCVDSIVTRKKFLDAHVDADVTVIDGRIALSNGQVLVSKGAEKIKEHAEMSDFSDKEVEVPVSACGTELSVSPTVLITVSYMVSAYLNLFKKTPTAERIYFDAFKMNTFATGELND